MKLGHEVYFDNKGQFRFSPEQIRRALPAARNRMLQDLRDASFQLMFVADTDPAIKTEYEKVNDAIKVVEKAVKPDDSETF